MTATSNSAPLAGGSLSSSATAQPPQPPPGHQQQHPLPQIYDSQMQYYYGSSMPNQPIPTYTAQNGAPQQFGTPPYYQDANGQFGQVPAQQQMMTAGHPYFYMAQPQQGGQHVAQSGQPQIFYYQQPLGQMAQQAAPMYFHPMQAASTPMLSEQMSMMPQIQSTNPQQSEQLRKSGAQISTTRTVPLTSSTPLPTSREYETVQRDRNRNSQSRYQCPIEHDDLPIDEISKITIDNHNDDTMSAEKENRFNKNRVEKLGRRGFAKPEVDSQLPHNFKTRLCMTHAAGINPCALGARCKFAHGLKELRASDIPTRYPNNKYKTKLCKNFARGGSGVCPYGLRCEFVHPSDTEFQNIPPYQRKMVEEHDSIPEDYVVARYQPRFMHTSGKATTPTKVTLKQRNVAGSMMCLSNTGRDLEAGGDFNHPEINENDLPPHLRRIRRGNPPVTRSRPSFSTKWTSVENLGLRGHY